MGCLKVDKTCFEPFELRFEPRRVLLRHGLAERLVPFSRLFQGRRNAVSPTALRACHFYVLWFEVKDTAHDVEQFPYQRRAANVEDSLRDKSTDVRPTREC